MFRLLTGLLRWRFETVWVPLSPGALWWTGLSCSRLSVLCAVLPKLPRLVSIPVCQFSNWKQPLPGIFLPWRYNVRNVWIYVLFVCLHFIYQCLHYMTVCLLHCNMSSIPKPSPSFQRPVLSALVPDNVYIQGSPILTANDQYFTIPQVSCVYVWYTFVYIQVIFCTEQYGSVPQKALGRCVNDAPVAFLKDFQVKCVTVLRSCPTGSPLHTLPMDLRTEVKSGQGGMFPVNQYCSKVLIDSGVFHFFFLHCRWCYCGSKWWSGHWPESVYFKYRCCFLFRYGDGNISKITA